MDEKVAAVNAGAWLANKAATTNNNLFMQAAPHREKGRACRGSSEAHQAAAPTRPSYQCTVKPFVAKVSTKKSVMLVETLQGDHRAERFAAERKQPPARWVVNGGKEMPQWKQIPGF
jgi:hypothetical protein